MIKKSGPSLWVRSSSISHGKDSIGKAGSALFTDEEFISTNIASADFQCISLGHVYEVAVTPDKHMHLVLPKDQYQAAGEYYADINLTGNNFKQGTPYYDKVANSLQKLPGPVQFLCARAQNSAVQEIHFADNHNILSHECLEHKYIQSKLCTAAPSVGCWQQAMLDMAAANAVGQADNSEGHDEHIAVLHQLYEWVGAVSCGIQDFELQTWPHQCSVTEISCHSWQGFLLPCQVEQALQFARKAVADKLCPWAVVSVWGYTCHPMPWIGSPPSCGSQTERENNYSIVILPDDQIVLFVASGSGDSFRTV